MKTKIIELCGLPGTGKTTILNETIKNFDNKSIIERKSIVRWVGTPFRQFLYFISILFRPSMLSFYLALKKIARRYDDYSKKSFFTIIAIYDCAKIIRLLGLKKYIVLEEGVIQNLSSLAHNKNLIIDQNVELILKKMEAICDWRIINCELAFDEVINRLRKRNNNDRFNNIKDDDKLFSLLQIKKSNIEKLVKLEKHVVSINLSGSEDIISKIASEIYN